MVFYGHAPLPPLENALGDLDGGSNLYPRQGRRAVVDGALDASPSKVLIERYKVDPSPDKAIQRPR